MNLSVRSKITLSYTLLTGTIIVFFSTFLYTLITHQLESIFNQDLLWEAKYAKDLFKSNDQSGLVDLDGVTKELEISFSFIDVKTEKVVYESSHFEHDRDPRLINFARKATPKGVWNQIVLENKSHSVLSQIFKTNSDESIYIQVIAPREDLYAIQRSVLHWILVLIPITIALVVVAGLYFSRKTLVPLEEGFHRMKQFTADASHELRIPITSIKGTLEVALRSHRTPAEYEEAIKDALEESDRLEGLAQDLLTLARADGGAVSLQKNVVSLPLFMNGLFHQAKELKNDLSVEIYMGDVPDISVSMDEKLIRRALLNLIENALHYNKPNGKIWIGISKQKAHVVFSVKDTGIGIPKEAHKKVFERFYRVDKARSRRQGGAGLGLSIVKSIIESHGGRLSIESAIDAGTRFDLTLPID